MADVQTAKRDRACKRMVVMDEINQLEFEIIATRAKIQRLRARRLAMLDAEPVLIGIENRLTVADGLYHANETSRHESIIARLYPEAASG